MTASCYGRPPPGLDPDELRGSLIVIEGPDGSGRTTHTRLLGKWLEEQGHAVEQTALRGSRLVAPELAEAREGNILSPRTRTLFYATDFFDRLENQIVPALRAGYVVLADRYIWTLMAREMVRGARHDWLRDIYAGALRPDLLVFLDAPPKVLAERALKQNQHLDYWESGMDMGLDRDWYDSFITYQQRIADVFRQLTAQDPFLVIDGDRRTKDVQAELRKAVADHLGTRALARA